jgi:predicted acetyltransferase
MKITLTQARRTDTAVVERILQLYEYDYSEWGGADVDAQGLYPTNDTDAMWRPGYHVFLIRVGGNLAGFAFVTRTPSHTDDGEVNSIDEFFVLRRYRRQGVGERVARTLFDRFPGRWEVNQLRENVAAQAFWRRVIGRYTGGHFHEVDLENDRWRGPVQVFTSPGAASWPGAFPTRSGEQWVGR